MNFPEIGPAYAPEIEISKKYWMSFPGFANNLNIIIDCNNFIAVKNLYSHVFGVQLIFVKSDCSNATLPKYHLHVRSYSGCETGPLHLQIKL